MTREGLDELLGRIGTLVTGAAPPSPRPSRSSCCARPRRASRSERDDDGAWRVSGRTAERVVAMADLTNLEALEYVQQRFRKMGVERALARARAREGDIVRVGPVELDYVEGFWLVSEHRSGEPASRGRYSEHRSREGRHVVDHAERAARRRRR